MFQRINEKWRGVSENKIKYLSENQEKEIKKLWVEKKKLKKMLKRKKKKI